MEGVRQVHLLEHLLEIRLRSLRPIKLIQETYENFDAPSEAFRQYHFFKNFPPKVMIVKEILGEVRASLEEKTYEPPVRIELTTCALQVRCSTTELERPTCKHVLNFRTAAIMAVIWRNLKSRGLGLMAGRLCR